MKTIRVSKTPCPWCGYEIDSHTEAFGIASPSPGDLSVCVKCHGFLQFGKKFALQKLEQSELVQIMAEDPDAYADLMKARDALRAVKWEGDRP
ncbi:hypothetical protein IFO70_10105 [Phormidium tenue FACHB-886]|nr:hypothetical protein [Phormidium tenue FACHB-886]